MQLLEAEGKNSGVSTLPKIRIIREPILIYSFPALFRRSIKVDDSLAPFLYTAGAVEGGYGQ